MNEDNKPRFDTVRRQQPIMHLSDMRHFRPLTKKQAVFYTDYGRLPTKEEELEMTIKTLSDLTPTNITHLEKFREFLRNLILFSNSPACDDPLERMKWKCEEYITHIDALLKDKK
jgi:hypothetical protein